jgi:hypothetical protein
MTNGLSKEYTNEEVLAAYDTELYFNAPRRKIVSESEEITEDILKDRRTKNVHTQTIRRKTYLVDVLECGHTIRKKWPNVKSTQCFDCDQEEFEAKYGCVMSDIHELRYKRYTADLLTKGE